MKRSRMKSVSKKLRRARPAFQAVYDAVDARSGGRCEVILALGFSREGARCEAQATEHHHLFKPRRSHHTPGEIVHICNLHHRRVDWPYKFGKLVYVGKVVIGDTERFHFDIRYAASKFAARAQGVLG